MSVLFDTSVLVPLFIQSHARHSACMAAVKSEPRTQRFIASHSLAEVFAVLTSAPLPTKIQAGLARKLIQNNLLAQFTCLDSTRQIYESALARMVDLNAGGGQIYDAILFECALAAGASKLYTDNLRHFQSLAIGTSMQIVSPHAH